MSAQSTVEDINRVVENLLKLGHAHDQGYAYLDLRDATIENVTYPQNRDVRRMASARSYVRYYDEVIRNRAYNVLLKDGAFVQLFYRFKEAVLLDHRLAYFSSPRSRLSFENERLGENDLNMVDTGESVPPTWFRFDYDAGTAAKQLAHPASHFTIGDNERCRIPVTSPLTPTQFFQFVFEHFYDAKGVNLPIQRNTYPSSIRDTDLAETHMVFP